MDENAWKQASFLFLSFSLFLRAVFLLSIFSEILDWAPHVIFEKGKKISFSSFVIFIVSNYEMKKKLE